jgi:4,5-dihydroxyphthalate decarboxylase
VSLTAAFGAWSRDLGLRARLAAAADLDFADIAPIAKAFAPMVREQAFDLSEMAIATFVMARAHSKPLVLLPVAVFSRYQEPALLCRANDTTIGGPADLRGKRIGIRAYSQTTAMWLRGTLLDDFGIAAGDMRWVTFEDAHVAECRDPPFAVRAPAGSNLVAMLRSGELDAIIVGGDMPEGDDLRPVFPDLDAAARRFHDTHGFEPVNHLLAARRSVVEEHPKPIAAIVRVAAEGRPSGRAILDPAVATAARYCFEQGLVPRLLELHELWDGLPPALARL